jgi:inositol 1,4,5-triphosphate receptor type 1/inositol 1,4,5-triphosphate receptor type 3
MLKYFGPNTNDKFEMQAELNNEMAMCRLFRFLQLFCENNNISMKKFLSTQINPDENKKTNSVNFIEEACLLLRKFFKIINNKIVNIPIYLLAFIAEITQLPCLDNQISLMKSTFFEDISYLASSFEESKNKKQRVFNEVAENE